MYPVLAEGADSRRHPTLRNDPPARNSGEDKSSKRRTLRPAARLKAPPQPRAGAGREPTAAVTARRSPAAARSGGRAPVGAWARIVCAPPPFRLRRAPEAYRKPTQRHAHKLREAAETIQTQNVSLEQANRLLKERSTAAMESLSATVDARDAYTAGHSRRVQ